MNYFNSENQICSAREKKEHILRTKLAERDNLVLSHLIQRARRFGVAFLRTERVIPLRFAEVSVRLLVHEERELLILAIHRDSQLNFSPSGIFIQDG
jgi:hypothetical protein